MGYAEIGANEMMLLSILLAMQLLQAKNCQIAMLTCFFGCRKFLNICSAYLHC